MKTIYFVLFACLFSVIAQAQPANDTCEIAETIPAASLNCIGPGPTTPGTTILGGTDPFTTPLACIANTDTGVWYRFTALGPDIQIEDNLAGALNVQIFEDNLCVGAFTTILCNSLPFTADNALTTGNSYLLLVAFDNGASGNFDLCITNWPELSNDEVCDALDISTTGTYAGTTYGTSNTPPWSNCTIYPNTQFFSYTVPAGVYKIEYVVTSSDLTSDLNVWVVQDCNAPVLIDEHCDPTFPLRSEEICVNPLEEYILAISTDLDNNGDFTLDVSDVIPTNCNSNEVCDVAQDLGVLTSNCELETFAECNVEACPDPITLAACDLSMGPAVWYQFTTDAQANVVDIIFDNSTFPDLEFIVIDMCGAGAIGRCSQMAGGLAELIQYGVNPNSTYYIGVVDPGSQGGDFDMSIRVYPDLDYDTPCYYYLTAGLHNLSNHCTTAELPGFINTTCPGALTESTAWFEVVVPPGTDALRMTLRNNLGDPLPGNVMIQMGLRDATLPCVAGAFTSLIEECTSLNDPVEFEDYCFPSLDSVVYYVLVGTETNETGSFDLLVEFVSSICTENDSCSLLAPQFTLEPMTPPNQTTSPTQICLSGCTNYACPEDIVLASCDLTLYNAVWYQIETDNGAAVLNLSVEATGADLFNPVVALFSGDCANLSPVTLSNVPDDCLVSTGPSLSVPAIPISNNTTYYLVVGSETAQGGTFDVCVTTEIMLQACINDHDLEVIDRENNLPFTDPFCPGELITFAYNVAYTVDPQGPGGNDCQWLQGVIPIFGEGWEYDNVAGVQSNIGGVWGWYPEGDVDYNWENFRYSTYTEGGKMKIAHYTGYTANYNLADAFVPGTLLPGGWYATSPGGSPGCVAGSTDPDETFGAPAGCGTTYNLSIEFSIRVKEECMPGDDLDVVIYEFSDGSIGCWNQQRCALDIPIVFNTATVECFEVHIPDSTYYICSGDMTDITLESGNPSAVITYTAVDNPDVNGEVSGMGNSIVQQLDNTSNCVTQEVEYQVVAQASPTAICNPDTAFITVVVYSPIEINQTPPIPFFCADEDVDINLLDFICGGSETYTLAWTDDRGGSGTDPMISAIYAPGLVTFDIDVTDDFGCMASGQVEVMVNEFLTVQISGIDAICEYEAPVVLTATALGGTGVYVEYDWERPDGSHSIGPDSTLDADQTGQYIVTVEDDRGCLATAMFDLTLYPRPQYTSTVFPNDATICDNGELVFIDLYVYHDPPYAGNFDIIWNTPPAFTQNLFGMYSFNTDIPGSYVFTVTDDFGCVNVDSFVVVVLAAPESFSDTLFSCDDGSGLAIFDLTDAESQVLGGANFDIEWFEDSLQTVIIVDPTNYMSGIDTVYAVVTDPDTDCTSPSTPIYLEFLSTFIADDALQIQCLELGGFGSFNLDNLIDSISAGNGSVEFYADTTLDTRITQTTDYETSDTIVYAIIRDLDNCISNIAQVVLITDTLLEAFPDTVMACLRIDGSATYDLTSANQTVTNGLSLTVSWYEDANGNTTIVDPTLYNTMATSAYATVSDGTCAANIAEITLQTFTSGQTPSDTLRACDEGGVGTFDLIANGNPIVLNGGTGIVRWFEDLDGNTPVATPDSYTTGNNNVYVIFEDDQGCISEITALPLVIGPIVAVVPDPLSECDPGTGQATFDLTVRDGQVSDNVVGRTVVWFTDMALTNQITPATAFNSAPGTVYAVVRQGACESLPVALDLDVTVDLPANPGAFDECIRANGLGMFDLNAINTQINSNSGFTIRYYTDTTDLSDSLTNIGSYESGMATIFAVVFDGDCRSFAQPVNLTISTQVTPVENLEFSECDEGSGLSTFDLTGYDAQVSGNSTSTVEWHELSDLSQPITSPSTYNSGDGVVYALVTDQRGCISLPVAVQLNVDILLFAGDATLSRCDEGGGIGVFDLTVWELEVKGNVGSRIVTWYEDTLAAPIINTTAYMAMDGDVLFAIISDGRCISAPRAYTLSVVNDLPAFPGAAVACDEGGTGTFNLNDALADILMGNNFTVEFYEDMGLSTLITGDISAYSSGVTTIYAITIDGNCRSLPVAVNLTLIPEIVAQTTMLDECDDGTGNAIFDLTSLESAVDNGQGFSVLWYADAGLTQPILSPGSHTSDGANVYAVLTNGNCTSMPVEIDLSITTIIGTGVEVFACNEGQGDGTFNLMVMDAAIIAVTGHTVSWFTDAGMTDPILLTTAYVSSGGTIYAFVSDGECISQPIAITLTLTDKLPADEAFLAYCDEGTGQRIFDLTSLETTINIGGFADVQWYLDAAGTMPLTGENAYLTSTRTVYAQVVDGPCRSDVIPISLVVNPLPSVDAGQPQQLDCRAAFIDIVGSGPAGNFTYTWTTSDGNILSGADALTVRVDQPGTYQLEVTDNSTGCFNRADVVISEDVNVPVANAGDDTDIDCFSASTEIGSTATTTGADIVISWSKDNVGITGSSQMITATEPGTYVVLVENTASGCSNSDTVIVISTIADLSEIQLDIDDPNCNGANTGCIEFISVTGGEGPYQISIDGVNFFSETEICNLGVGDYQLVVRDVNGCFVSESATINQPEVLSVQIMGNNLVNYKDSTTLAAVHSPSSAEIATYTWTSDNHFNTSIDSIVVATGLTEFPVSVTIEDENGCIATNQITVYVRKNFKVYVPNAFSPFKKDNINDKFFFMGDEDIVTSVDFFRVYSRWGEKLYERTNLDINDDREGWDGTFKGEEMLPGVYTYVAQVTFVDGSVQQVQGEVILVN